MKTLHLTIIAILICSTLLYLKPIQAYAANDVEIQNIQVAPSEIKVGDTLKITATLVNNSTNPIFLSYGVCEGKFSVIFDNHVAVDKKNVPCVLMAIEQRLDPGTKTTGTSPGSFPPHGTPTVTYTANATGIANATVTFSYSDSGIEKTISKSFLFTINDNGTKIKTVNNTVLSPLKQFQSGIAASKVACNQGFQLILKREDISPACVKPDTAQKLIERGWGFMRGVQTFFPLGNITNSTSLGNNTLPASFEPCQDPYPQNYTGIPVLSMPVNSTEKICVRYHNLNDVPVRIGIGISEANNLTQDAKDVSTWNDSGNNTISAGNSTIVYWVKTGNHKGLYGLTIFCVPMPFAVGYDNSTLAQSNFPWLGQSTWFCPAEFYDFHIDSTTGFKVGYIVEK